MTVQANLEPLMLRATRPIGALAGRLLRLLPRDAAVNLAVFRIVVGLLFLVTGEVRAAGDWARLPAALAVVPRGWGWALALFPPNATAARIASAVVIGGAALGLAGWYARRAFACVTIAALYLLALPLRSGLPYHYQHLVWFAAICAASPCADALVLGRRGRRPRSDAPADGRSAAYGVPLRVVWLLVGVIFFFPGVWKLRASGLAWITSDNLRNQLYWKWAVTPDLAPPFRVDRFPWLLHAGAGAVVALELTFAFALWRRWSRRLVVAGALAFHASAYLFMGIDFSGLWLTYVAFVDWDSLARRWSRAGDVAPPAPGEAIPPLSRVAPALLAGALLVAGAADAGARGVTRGWPFACYPTFQDRAGTRMPVLAIALVRAGGDELPLDTGGAGGTVAVAVPGASARERVFGLRLIAGARAPDASARFAAYWQRLRERASAPQLPPDARAVRFYAAELSTLPEDRGQPPRARALLYELPLASEARPSTKMPRARSGAITSSSSDDSASVK